MNHLSYDQQMTAVLPELQLPPPLVDDFNGKGVADHHRLDVFMYYNKYSYSIPGRICNIIYNSHPPRIVRYLKLYDRQLQVTCHFVDHFFIV